MPAAHSEAGQILQGAHELLQAALSAARQITQQGKRIDEHQMLSARVAYAATEYRAAADARALAQNTTPQFAQLADAAVAHLCAGMRARLEAAQDELGITETLPRAFPPALCKELRAANSEAAFRAIGRHAIELRGRMEPPLAETHEQVRESVREFAQQEVAPQAENIHRQDADIPESFISKMGELGYFGLSIPEQYGGFELGNLAMLLTTEELSRASLAAAGSLITRPEILAKALLAGGTEAQKAHWLPKLASGETMVAVSVTEPDTGSDVAAVRCRAVAGEFQGQSGFRISGAKAWCTFAGRADIIALLARSESESNYAGAKGLSLFIVEKPAFAGHTFEYVQPGEGGGRITGKADATPGYRGMHSFTLQLENYFVPAANLVGEAAGRGRGFALQMGGFAAGRLQTGGRACGLAQAALECTANYVAGRMQFGRALSEFQYTQYTLGRMAAQLFGARALCYAAAAAMDGDARRAAPLAAQAKLLACDAAVEISQQGQLMHGGWGYAEEYPISRYVVDAQVLPIFEGVKPVLELYVIGRALLR